MSKGHYVALLLLLLVVAAAVAGSTQPGAPVIIEGPGQEYPVETVLPVERVCSALGSEVSSFRPRSQYDPTASPEEGYGRCATGEVVCIKVVESRWWRGTPPSGQADYRPARTTMDSQWVNLCEDICGGEQQVLQQWGDDLVFEYNLQPEFNTASCELAISCTCRNLLRTVVSRNRNHCTVESTVALNKE